jgi:lactoylglutathione lyase
VFTEMFPILTTADLPRALAFYRDVCGGTVSYRFPPDGDPVYVGVDLGSAHLGISLDAGKPRRGADLCVYTADCDAAVERLRAHGAAVVEEPADQPWGERMARVEDPDGNHLVIMTRLS